MVNRSFIVVTACCLVFSFTAAQRSVSELEALVQKNPNDVGVLIELGTLYHNQGGAGNEDAVEKGFTYLDKALQLDSTNAIALAYRGSLRTMRGRDAWWPFTKLSHVDKGIDEMDKSVDISSDNITVRLVRGINGVQLPSMFNRLSTSIKDFDYLLGDKRFSYLDSSLQSRIYCWAGVAQSRDHRAGRAKELLQKAIAASPNSDTARRAEQELNNLH